MTIAAREIHLKSRPNGLPSLDNFEVVSRTLPELAPGQVLVRTTWMSVDPYMRGRMRDRPSYIAPFQIGAALEGAAVGVVERSADDRFKPGDFVSHFSGWRDYALADASTGAPCNLPSWCSCRPSRCSAASVSPRARALTMQPVCESRTPSQPPMAPAPTMATR